MTNKKKMFGVAVFIAAREHVDKFDQGGYPYITHPMRIAMRLRTNDDELMCIAILHDVIEDSKVTFQELLDQGFSQRVVDALKCLTHVKGVSYDDYIDGMKDNIDALRVKREDLIDNSSLVRLKGVRQKDFDRMNKYINAFVKVERYIAEYMERAKNESQH